MAVDSRTSKIVLTRLNSGAMAGCALHSPEANADNSAFQTESGIDTVWSVHSRTAVAAALASSAAPDVLSARMVSTSLSHRIVLLPCCTHPRALTDELSAAIG